MSDPLINSNQSHDELEDLNPKAIIIKTIVALIILGLVLGVISTLFKEPVEAFSRFFIELTGSWGTEVWSCLHGLIPSVETLISQEEARLIGQVVGVGAGFFFPDALTLPIPPDTFLIAGVMGGLAFWPTAIGASIGSILGGTLGFLMIKRLSSVAWVQRTLKKKLTFGESFMQRYGVLALALGALTPLPYSVISWACGATGMRLMTFLLVSLLRIPRVIGYLWFIQTTLSMT